MKARRCGVLVLAAVTSCALLGGTARAATTCTYDAATHAVAASIDPIPLGTPTLATRPGSTAGDPVEIQVFLNGTVLDCGDATVDNTDSISAAATGGGSVVVGAEAVAFAPGFTAEATGASEIEIHLSGFSQVEYHAPFDTPATLSAGSKGIAVNGDGDVDLTYDGRPPVMLQGGNLDDVVTARGGHGSGTALPASQAFHAEGGRFVPSGNDLLLGHAGHDELALTVSQSGTALGFGGDDQLRAGFKGAYRLEGGAGNDELTVTSGSPTTADRTVLMLGGAGDDSLSVQGAGSAAVLFGGAGRDSFSSANGFADVVDGGSGRDAATVDASDLVSAVETVTVP
jgi:Ca2+-binding RTX toxin-like protein